VLVRQFRYPAYVNGYDDLLIEAAAGLLDDESPETRIRAEAEEENRLPTRRHPKSVRSLHEALARSPKNYHFFVAEYQPSMRVGSGGGIAERRRGYRSAVKLPIDQALAMIADGPHRRCQDHHAAAICGAEYFFGETITVVPANGRDP